jgi:hypothetical protein
MQVGGSDITNVSVGTGTFSAGSTADLAITAPGFQPNFAMFIGTQATAAGTITRALGTVGFASSSTKEFTMCWGIDDAQTMTATIDAVSYTDSAASMSQITAGAETIDLLANLKSFDTNGFTLAITNAATAAWQFGYLLIKGGQWDVGTTTVSGISFDPKCLFTAITAATSNATVTVNAASSVGAAVSTSTEAAALGRQDDAILNTAVFLESSNSKIIVTTASNNCDFTNFGTGQWTITSAGVGSGWQLGWFAAADNAVVFDPLANPLQTNQAVKRSNFY